MASGGKRVGDLSGIGSDTKRSAIKQQIEDAADFAKVLEQPFVAMEESGQKESGQKESIRDPIYDTCGILPKVFGTLKTENKKIE